jgi:phosphoribosylcarboxyaminoimidazole (NCAIR) mutase/HPt (histidine-containing phosphotransfer) domain-containing protein
VPVAEEAAQTAEFLGNRVLRVYDVGIAGIHRLLDHLDVIRQANCVIAVAGMEGALAGVIAGLVQVPVIGVPTSVGYGTGYQGASALLTMLNSCSNGIATVNIDNGFGAAYLASQINHQTEQQKVWYQETDQLLEDAHIRIPDGYHYAGESMSTLHWMLRLFAESYPVKKEALQQFYEAWEKAEDKMLQTTQAQTLQQKEGYTATVHSLKSNARSIGANRLADFCYEHEVRSREGDFFYVQMHWTELLQEWQRVVTGIWNYFGEEDIS